MIYLDYNATTPIDPEVLAAMEPFFKQQFGNPSNTYSLGLSARQAVAQAREKVAHLIGAQSAEILFTGSGSEANNTVIKGVAETYHAKGKHIITSMIEHPAILEPLKFLQQRFGFEVTVVPVDETGAVAVKDVQAALRPDTILVTIMHSNNETGTLQPIKEIGALCRAAGVLFHTDASQSAGKVSLDVTDLQVDFLTLAGHKLYAPKGIGALFIKNGLTIEPLIHGASQEGGRRASTENVPYIVGLGTACEKAADFLLTTPFVALRNYFYHQLTANFGQQIRINGDLAHNLPNTLNVSFVGRNGAQLLNQLTGVAASTGSACHSGSTQSSPVLAAMGIPSEVAQGAIRFSIGKLTTKAEIDDVISQLQNLLA